MEVIKTLRNVATKSETNFIGPKNHVARRRSLSRRRIVPVTVPLHIRIPRLYSTAIVQLYDHAECQR